MRSGRLEGAALNASKHGSSALFQPDVFKIVSEGLRRIDIEIVEGAGHLAFHRNCSAAFDVCSPDCREFGLAIDQHAKMMMSNDEVLPTVLISTES